MDNFEIEGLQDLCLGEELTKTVAAKLGAVPKKPPVSKDIKVIKDIQDIKDAKVIKDIQDIKNTKVIKDIKDANVTEDVKSIPEESSFAAQSTSSQNTTPAMQRRQMKKKNRKDRRRDPEVNTVEEKTTVDNAAATNRGNAHNTRNPSAPGAGRGITRSNSAKSVPSCNRLGQPSTDEITKLLFKSQSTVNVKTGIRNLPDSFFNDDLPEEIQENEEKNKKKRKKKGRKKGASGGSNPPEIKDSEKRDSDKENDRQGSEELDDLILQEATGDSDGKEVTDDGFMYNWKNVTKNGDVKKCILVDGNSLSQTKRLIEISYDRYSRDEGRPMKGDVVVVKSQGKLKDGTMIDDNPTLVFRVGEYEVIQGLDLCVQSMLKNELSIISIKPSMAYGELGRKPDVPPDSRITYLFGLLHFEKQKDISELTWAQRRKMGQSRMRIANWWYSRKEYSIAVKCYKRALLFYNNIPTDQKCSTTEEYRELLTLMEERLRVMRQVANIFKRIANLIQSGHIET